MARTSVVVWSVAALVVIILAALAAIYGPGLYDEGKAVVGPIVDLARVEDRLAALDSEFPFEPPADGNVEEARFMVFLDIRRTLEPKYREWREFAQQLEREGQEDWDAAKEALASVRTVRVFQIDTLREHRMSPAEFVFIEDLAYGVWADELVGRIEDERVAQAVREMTVADLEVLDELEGRYGRSTTSRHFADHLRARLAGSEDAAPPQIDGITEGTAALFWKHRDELEALDFEEYAGLHRMSRNADDIKIEINDE
jgi:hypothetical protein